MHTKFKLGLLLCLLAGPVLAKDFGVQGPVFPIKEVDMRKLLLESAARAPLDKINQERKESAEKYLDSLPHRDLPAASENKLVWFDPSIELADDIKSLVKDSQGNYQWVVVYKKGTKVNPIRTHRPTTQLLFFDARSDDQVAFVNKMIAAYPLTIYPIETSGMNPVNVMKKVHKETFYANDALFKRYPIKTLPTLIFAGKESHSDYLGLLSFTLPFDPKLAKPYMPEVGQNFTTQKSGLKK